MGPISGNDFRPGSEQNLVAFYELVPAAEEEDLATHHEYQHEYQHEDPSDVAGSLSDQAEGDWFAHDIEPDDVEEDEPTPLTPLQQLGMLEHVLGAEEIDED